MRILAPGMPAMLGPCSTKRCTYRQNFGAERWAVVLSGLLLLGWLARCAVLAFFALVFGASGARAGPQPQNAVIYGVLLHLRFRAGLRAVLFGLLFLGPLACGRARATPCQPSGLGPGWGPESWHPRHHLGLGWATCIASHIIAQDTFLKQKT